MRNLKKVLAVLVVVALFATMFAVPAMAETASSSDAAKIATDLGLLKGDGNGVDESYLGKDTTRLQAAIIYLRLMGKEAEALAYQGENFADATGWQGGVNVMAYLKNNPDLGWQGDGVKFYPNQKANAQMIYKVLLTAMGYKQGTDFDYADVKGFAKAKGLKALFNTTGAITNADLATAIVEALKAPVVGGKTLAEVLVAAKVIDPAKAAAAGLLVAIASVTAPAAVEVDFGGDATKVLPATVKATMTDATTKDVAVKWDAVDTTKEGKATVKGAVDGFAAGVTIDVTVKVQVLDVAKVEINNTREVVVTYNKAVSGDPVKDKANYTVNDKAVNSVDLSADSKSVTLTLAQGNAIANYKADCSVKIKKEVGLTADKTVSGLACRDTSVPTLVSVATTGPRTMVLTFSEVMNETVDGINTVGSLKVDGNLIGLDSTTVSYNKKDVTVNTLSDLTEANHTVEVAANNNLRDGAGYMAAQGTVTFKYVKDAAAIAVTVKESSETSVTLKFSKAMQASTLTGNTNLRFSHSYKGSAGNTEVTNTAVTKVSDTEFSVSFAGKPFPPGSTTLYIYYNSASGSKVKDNYGVELPETALTITTSADTTKPTVTAAEFVDANTVKVTFSEDVETAIATDTVKFPNSAMNTANYTLKSGTDGIAITSIAADGTSKKVFKLTTAVINGGTLTLTVKNVKDLSVAANKMDDQTITFAATDKVAPTVSTASKVANKKIRVNFSEAMDVASISDKAMYKINGTIALGDNDSIEVINSNKSVVITLSTQATYDNAVSVLVGRVKDAAGNYTATYQNSVAVADLANLAAKAVEVTGKNSVKITVEDVITGVVRTDFQVKIGGGAFTAPNSISEVTVADGKTYITLNTADITDTTGANVRVATYNGTDLTGGATAGAANSFGQKLQIDTFVGGVAQGTGVAVTDKYAPVIVSADTTDIWANDDENVGTDATHQNYKLDTITVVFSEPLYTPSVTDSDFTVEGYTVKSISVVGTTVVLNLDQLSIQDYDAKPKITVAEVQDSNRNAATNISIDSSNANYTDHVQNPNP